MRFDKNIIEAVKAKGHDRVVIAQNTGLIFSCKVTKEIKVDMNQAVLLKACLVSGAKAITFVGDVVVRGPYIAMDLKDESTT